MEEERHLLIPRDNHLKPGLYIPESIRTLDPFKDPIDLVI